MPLKSPVFEDDAQTLAARKVWAVLVAVAVAVSVTGFLIYVFAHGSRLRLLATVIALDVLCLSAYVALRAGYIRTTAVCFVLSAQLIQFYAAWGAGGLSAPVLSSSLVVVAIAGIILGAWAAFWSGLLSIVGLGCLAWVESSGGLPPPLIIHTPLTRWLALASYITVLMVVQVVVAWVVRKAELQVLENSRKRNEVEQAFRNQVTIHHQMYETSMDAYVRVDLSGRILEFNDVYCRMLGYEAHELSQLSFQDLTPRRWLEMEEAIIKEEVLANGYSRIFEKEYRCKDGRLIPVELRVSLLRNQQGRPVSMWAFVRDVSERRQAEARLRESEEKFARAFRCAPVMFSITTLDTGVYLEVNDYGLRLGGYTREEVIGRTSQELGWISDDQRRRLIEFSLSHDRSAGMEMLFTAKDGRKISGFVHADEISIGGRACLLCVTTDVTERKQLEEQYRQSQKMDAVGQLAGGVAHDFNNILTASMMQLALLQAESGLNPGVHQGLESLKGLHTRAARLTRQLLTFSRRQPVRMVCVDLNEVLRNLLSMLGSLIGEHIRMEQQLSAEPQWVNADVGMVEQLITNLVVNARDAMQPQGGRLELRVCPLHLGPAEAARNPEAREGDFVCLSVTDTGCGMSPEVQARIFEPFFTTKELGKGTGLGLATVFGIVHQHDGWIEVQSTEGEGSCFRVSFPRLVLERDDSSEHRPDVSGHGTETILFVEDEALVRIATVGGLRSRGYRVLTAVSGPDALHVWAQNKDEIELLLTDAVMPEGMSGMDLTRELRRERPGLKVIVVSGYNPEVNELGRSGCPEIHYLAKPFELHQLTEMVRRVLDQ